MTFDGSLEWFKREHSLTCDGKLFIEKKNSFFASLKPSQSASLVLLFNFSGRIFLSIIGNLFSNLYKVLKGKGI